MKNCQDCTDKDCIGCSNIEKAIDNKPHQSNFDLFSSLGEATRPVTKKEMLLLAVTKMSEEECERFWNKIINKF